MSTSKRKIKFLLQRAPANADTVMTVLSFRTQVSTLRAKSSFLQRKNSADTLMYVGKPASFLTSLLKEGNGRDLKSIPLFVQQFVKEEK